MCVISVFFTSPVKRKETIYRCNVLQLLKLLTFLSIFTFQKYLLEIYFFCILFVIYYSFCILFKRKLVGTRQDEINIVIVGYARVHKLYVVI